MRDSKSGGKKPIQEVQELRARKPKLERVSHYVTKDKKAGDILKRFGVGIEQARRKTGIDIIGEIAWGGHFCVFYQSKQDLIDILVPYFKAGLENNEFCMWITSKPLSAKDAEQSLRQAVKNLDDCIKRGQIEILDYCQWYTKWGKFDYDKVLQGWVEKHDQAVKRGFDGLRLSGNTFWLEEKDWREFTEYERTINSVLGQCRMLAVCTYSLHKCGVSEVIDVVGNHQFTVIKQEGKWVLVESAGRKKAEEAYRALVDHSLQGLEIFQDGRTVFANQAMAEITGYTVDEILAMSSQQIQNFVHPEDRALVWSRHQDRLKGKHPPERYEFRGIRKDGTMCWLEIHASRIEYQGKPAIQAAYVDVTERKKAEERIREQSEFLRNTIESLSYPFYVIDANDKTIKMANSTAWQGKLPEKITCYMLSHKQNKPCSGADRPCPLEDIKKTKQPVIVEHIHYDKDGNPRNVEVHCYPIFDNEQNVSQVIEYCLDITERKRAEQLLRKERDKAQKYLDIAGVMLVAIDVEERVGLVNKKGCEILGYKEEEIIGKKWFDNFLPERVRKEVKAVFEKIVAGKLNPVEYFENPIFTKDGDERLIAWHNTLLRAEQGDIIGTLSSGEDITERKLAEEALLAANQQLIASEQQLKVSNQQLIASQEEIQSLANFPSENSNPVLRIAKDGIVLYSNEAGMSLLTAWGTQIGRRLPDKWRKFTADVFGSGSSKETEYEYGDCVLSLTFTPVVDLGYVNVYGLDITERKKAEEAYRSLVDHSLQGLAILQDGRVVFANQAMAEISGYTVEEMFAMSLEQVQAFVHPDERELVWSRHRGRLDGKPLPDQYEFRGIRKDGSACWLELHASLVEYQGRPAIQVAYVDITERKQAEQALQEREERLELFFSQSLDGFFFMMLDEPVRWDETVDKEKALDYVFSNQRITKVNDAMLLQYRASREQFIDLTPNDFYAHNIAYGRDVWRDFFDAGRLHLETDERKLDGTPIWIDGDYICLYDSQGRITGHFGVQREITEEKRAREALRESRDYLQKLTNSMWDAVFSVKMPERVIEWANDSFRLIGYEPEECIGKTTEFLYPDDSEFLDFGNKLKGAMAARKDVLHAEQILKRKNGETFPAEITTTFFREKGEIVRVTSIVRDVSERKRAEEALQKRTEELTIMNEMAIELAVASSTTDIYKLVCEKLKGITGALFTGITSYDSQRQELSIEHISTDSKFIITANKILGRKVKELRIPLEPRHIQEMLSEKAKRLEGLNELMFGTIPRAVVNTLKRALKIGDVYGLGLNYGGKVIGTMTVLMPQQKALLSIEMLQAFANLVATSLKRMKAEQAMHESEQKYKALVEQSLQGIIILQDFQIVFANPTAAKIAGITVEEVLALSPEDIKAFIPVEEQAAILQRYEDRLVDKPIEHNYELRLVRKNGDGFWLDLFVSQIEYLGKSAIQVAFIDITERKRVEEALRESQENYRMVSALTSDYIVKTKVEPNGQMVLVSTTDRLVNMTSYAVEELRSQSSWSKIVHPDDFDKFQDFWKRIVSSRKSCELEFRGIDRRQQFEWLHAYGQPILDEKNDRVISIVFAAKDITERKRAEEALSASEERYRAIFEQAADAIVLIDAETGELLEFNDRTHENLGYTREEFRKLKIPDLEVIESAEEVAKHIEKIVRENADTFETKHRTKGGEIRDVQVSSRAISICEKDLVQSIWRDITERKRAEEAIWASESEKRSILNAISDRILFHDTDMVIRWGNEAVAISVGLTQRELVGCYCYELWHGRSVPCERCPVLRAIETGSHTEGIITTPDERFWEVIGEPVRDRDGKIKGVIEIARDITERKKAEEKFLDDQAQLKSLASQLTLAEERERRRLATELHDQISQSLVISKIKLEALCKSGYGKELDKALDEVCNSLGQTIADTRSLTFDLSSPILYELGFEAAVAEWLTEQIQDKHGIKTEFEDDGRPKPLDNDIRVLLFRNVRELLINVVRHAHAKKIKVSIYKVDDRIRVDVEDDGVGFNPAEAISMAVETNGFGLFSIRERLEQLGGHLEIESELSHGSRITMFAPLKGKQNTKRKQK